VRSAFKRGITSSEQLEEFGMPLLVRFRARYGYGKNAPAQEKPVYFPLEAQDIQRAFPAH
jgi:hypothetical protein